MEGDTWVFVVTAADIAAANARTVGEALRFVPGLFFSQGDQGSEGAVNIRGAEAVPLVMIDNRPVSEPQQGSFSFDEFPTDNIAKIKIIKGPASAAYGFGGLNGIINIITKRGAGDPSAHLQVARSKNNSRDDWIEASGTEERLNYYVTGSWRSSAGFDLSDDFQATQYQGEGLRRESDYERKNISMNLGLDLSDKASLALLSGLYRADRGLSPYKQ